METRRLSGRQITVIVVAGCLALVLLPWGAFAAGRQLVTVVGADGSKAGVTKNGALKVLSKETGTPVQVAVTLNNQPSTYYVLGHGTVAVTDAVLSQTNTGATRLNVSLRLQAGNKDCSTVSGPSLGSIVEYSFLQAEEVVPIDLATPVTATAKTVCLVPSIGSNPGLFFSLVVNGRQL